VVVFVLIADNIAPGTFTVLEGQVVPTPFVGAATTQLFVKGRPAAADVGVAVTLIASEAPGFSVAPLPPAAQVRTNPAIAQLIEPVLGGVTTVTDDP